MTSIKTLDKTLEKINNELTQRQAALQNILSAIENENPVEKIDLKLLERFLPVRIQTPPEITVPTPKWLTLFGELDRHRAQDRQQRQTHTDAVRARIKSRLETSQKRIHPFLAAYTAKSLKAFKAKSDPAVSAVTHALSHLRTLEDGLSGNNRSRDILDAYQLIQHLILREYNSTNLALQFIALTSNAAPGTKSGNIAAPDVASAIKKVVLQPKTILPRLRAHLADPNLQIDPQAADAAIASLANLIRAFPEVKPLAENWITPPIGSVTHVAGYLSRLAVKIDGQIASNMGDSAFTPEYQEFRKKLDSLIPREAPSRPTKTQSRFLYWIDADHKNYLKEISRSTASSPYALVNTAQVGTGKTYTLPIVLSLLAQNDATRFPGHKHAFIFITEASLVDASRDAFIRDAGVPPDTVATGSIDQAGTLKPGQILICSRHGMPAANRHAYTIAAQALRKRNIRVIVAADEASFLKNQETETSQTMSRFLTELHKQKTLAAFYRLTATPITNDTGDFLQLLRTNAINFRLLATKHPNIVKRMRKTWIEICRTTPNGPTFENLLSLAAKGNASIGLATRIASPQGHSDSYAITASDPAALVLALYALATAPSGAISASSSSKNISPTPSINDALAFLGFTTQNVQSATATSIVPLPAPIFHPGTRDPRATFTLLPLIHEAANHVAFDRVLNAGDDPAHLAIHFKLADTNPIEAAVFLSLINTASQLANFSSFRAIMRQLKDKPTLHRRLKHHIAAATRAMRLSLLHAQTPELPYSYESVDFAFTTAAPAEDRNGLKHKTASSPDADQRKSITQTVNLPRLNAKTATGSGGVHQFIQHLGAKHVSILGNPLMDGFAKELAPMDYYALHDLINAPPPTTKTETLRRRANIARATESILEQTSILFGSNPTENGIIETLKTDVESVTENGTIRFPVSPLELPGLFKDTVRKVVLDTLEKGPATNKFLQSLSSEGSNPLAVYAIVFQAAESLSLPLIGHFLKDAIKRLTNDLRTRSITLDLDESDFETIAKFAITKASTMTNLLSDTANFARTTGVPIVAATNFRASARVVANKLETSALTGELAPEDRNQALALFDQIEDNMAKTLVCTAKSILKGINIHNCMYGATIDGVANAEHRVQLAGRLRSLHKPQLAAIDAALGALPADHPTAQYLTVLKQNTKVFDVFSNKILAGFPDIQARKHHLLETYLAATALKDMFNLSDEVVFYTNAATESFNTQTVKKYAARHYDEHLNNLIARLPKRGTVTASNLMHALDAQIDVIRAANAAGASLREHFSNTPSPTRGRSAKKDAQ